MHDTFAGRRPFEESAFPSICELMSIYRVPTSVYGMGGLSTPAAARGVAGPGGQGLLCAPAALLSRFKILSSTVHASQDQGRQRARVGRDLECRSVSA